MEAVMNQPIANYTVPNQTRGDQSTMNHAATKQATMDQEQISAHVASENSKECPVCHARCFSDMEVCYGCLYQFPQENLTSPRQDSLAHPAHAQNQTHAQAHAQIQTHAQLEEQSICRHNDCTKNSTLTHPAHAQTHVQTHAQLEEQEEITQSPALSQDQSKQHLVPTLPKERVALPFGVTQPAHARVMPGSYDDFKTVQEIPLTESQCLEVCIAFNVRQMR